MNKKGIWVIAIIAALLLIGLAVTWYGLSERKDKIEDATTSLSVEEFAPEPPKIFGLPADSFLIEQYTIARNENLSDILSAEGISYPTLQTLLNNSKDFFDVRRMKVGNSYYLLREQGDSTRQAKYFVYEQNKIDYIVFQLGDSLITYKGEKEVKHILKSTSGVITSSLWNSMIESGASPALAVELSDIYAWTIDFFGIQKGDKYKLIYEEKYVDSISVGIHAIYASVFNHMNNDYFAFQFEQDSTLSYFNEKGESLRKAFLKAPLNYKRVSSGFSNRRLHPILKIYRPHHGVDYAAASGTPVMSIGDGTVVKKSYQRGGAGYYLKIKHNAVYTTTYMHLKNFAKGMAVGKRVKQGEVIGYVGSTGGSTGPHLDFRVQKNGSYINPLNMESPPVEPISEQNLEDFTFKKDSLLNELNKVHFPVGETERITL